MRRVERSVKKKTAVEKKAKTIEKKEHSEKAMENHETQSFMNLFYHEGGYIINF
jgi:hypothetical protein